jgi:hypothetical protein
MKVWIATSRTEEAGNAEEDLGTDGVLASDLIIGAFRSARGVA